MIEWIDSCAHRSATGYIAASVYKSTSQARNQITIRFSPEAVSDLRLIYGDKLLIGFDKTTKQICFKRTSDGTGYKLTYASSGQKNPGKSRVLCVQATTDFLPVPTQQYTKEDVKVQATHVEINAPGFFKDYK